MYSSVKFWDKKASSYDEIANKYEKSYKELVEYIKNLVAKNDVVLDFACGTGLVCNRLAPFVEKVVAIDTSSGMLEMAKQKAFENNIGNIEFKQISIINADFKDETFNIILAINVLILIRNIDEILSKINALLKPGGYFISATAILKERKKKHRNFIYSFLRLVRLMPSFKSYSQNELLELIEKHGFQIIESRNMAYDPPNIFIVATKN